MKQRIACGIAALLVWGACAEAEARVCLQVDGTRVSEIPCPQSPRLVCRNDINAEGDGYATRYNVSFEQCHRTCLQDDDCLYFEHYTGNGKRDCGLWNQLPRLQVNRAQDSRVCTWR